MVWARAQKTRQGGIRHPREQVFRGLCFSRQVVLQDRHEDGWKCFAAVLPKEGLDSWLDAHGLPVYHP